MTICTWFLQGVCKFGDECQNSHGDIRAAYHLDESLPMIVLDINKVLLYRRPKREVVFRPGLEQFLFYCFKKCNVVFWTTMKEWNMENLVAKIVSKVKAYRRENQLNMKRPLKRPLEPVFCLHQDHCLFASKSLPSFLCEFPEDRFRPLVFKDLRLIWQNFPKFGVHNTLLVDDSWYKSALNPLMSTYVISTWVPGRESLDPLLKIVDRIVGAKLTRQVVGPVSTINYFVHHGEDDVGIMKNFGVPSDGDIRHLFTLPGEEYKLLYDYLLQSPIQELVKATCAPKHFEFFLRQLREMKLGIPSELWKHLNKK